MGSRSLLKLWASLRPKLPLTAVRAPAALPPPLRLCELEDRVLFSAAPLPLPADLLPPADADAAAHSPAGELQTMPDNALSEQTPSQHPLADEALADAVVEKGLAPLKPDAVEFVAINSAAEFPPAELTPESPHARATHELIVVDTAAHDSDQFVEDLLSRADRSRGLEVAVLEAARDGIEQISEVLAGYEDPDAVT